MGEIADAMIEGDSCDMCGVPFMDNGFGVPRRCQPCILENGKAFKGQMPGKTT